MTSTGYDLTAGAGELALRRHGLDGDRLRNISYAVANAYCRATGAGLDSRIDDLAQHIALTITRRALRYDPQKSGPDYSFIDYCFDVGDNACGDWMRKKSEGFGDRRYGHDGRLVLMGDDINDVTQEDATVTDDGHQVSRHWQHTASTLQAPFKDWPTVTERRAIAWARAAEHVGLTLDEFVARACDVYARAIPEAA